jgi:hypothetical protein
MGIRSLAKSMEILHSLEKLIIHFDKFIKFHYYHKVLDALKLHVVISEES